MESREGNITVTVKASRPERINKMNKINIQQARRLLEINEPVYLIVGNEFLGITKQDLLASCEDGNRKYYHFNRSTIRELIRQRFNIDTHSWKYMANDTGHLLLSV